MSENFRTLLYFTESYPYGIGEQWKTNELNVLSTKFDNIHVIPRIYNGNTQAVAPIPGITYHKPLLENIPHQRFLLTLLKILTSPFRTFFFTELIKYCLFDTRRIFQWINSCSLQLNLLNHPLIQRLFLEENDKTLAYFFWGRGTVEVLPLIQKKNIKNIVRLHGYDLYLFRYKSNYIPFHSKVLSYCDKILFVSLQGLEYLTTLYPHLSDKFKYSPLGTLDYGMSKMSDDGVLRIISCSSLISLKRVSIIAKALSEIKNINIEWTHLGDGPLKSEILTIAKTFPSNVSLSLPGWIASEKIKEYYQNKYVDLFINVSSTEGVPVSIMEAMSAAVPVIATDVGGTHEIVNSTNGSLLNANLTSEKLKLEIETFYKLDYEEKKKLRFSARQTYLNKYNALDNAAHLYQIMIN